MVYISLQARRRREEQVKMRFEAFQPRMQGQFHSLVFACCMCRELEQHIESQQLATARLKAAP
jgi:hypothetical protein